MSGKKHIGFVTCKSLERYFPSRKEPLFTHDDQLAADDLISKGFIVSPIVWGTPFSQIKEKKIDLLIIRSPWDYMDSLSNREGFTKWIQGLRDEKVPVLNSVGIMLWNLDKHYLLDLAQKGVSIVPTQILPKKSTFDPLSYFLSNGPFVIKPTISAGARDTFRILNDLEATKLLDKLHLENLDYLLQPYISSIETIGEWSLVFLNGEYSHAVLKKPKENFWLVQDELGGSVHFETPPTEIIQFAQNSYNQILSAYELKNGKASEQILYARVDVLPHDNHFFIGELELIEPELFFLDRNSPEKTAYRPALEKFHHGILSFFKVSP